MRTTFKLTDGDMVALFQFVRLLSFHDFTLEPGEVVNLQFVVFPTHCHQHVKGLQHVDLLESATCDERENLSVAASIEKV